MKNKQKIFALSALLLAASCKVYREPSLGNKTSYPFAMVNVGNSIYQLNASADGQSSDGNIVKFDFNASSGELVRKEFASTPRLGTSLAVDVSGKKLAASFGSENPEIRIFNIEQGIVELQELRFVVPNGGVPSQLQFLEGSALGKSNSLFVLFATRAGTPSSRVHLFEIADSSSRSLMSFPDGLSKYGIDEASFGFAAPTISEQRNVLLMFPQGLAQTFDLIRTDFFEFLRGNLKPSVDLRPYSIAAVDLKNFLTSGNLELSTAFAPLIYNEFGNSPEFLNTATSPVINFAENQVNAIGFDENLPSNKNQLLRSQIGFSSLKSSSKCSNLLKTDEDNQISEPIPSNNNTDTQNDSQKVIFSSDDSEEVFELEMSKNLTEEIAQLPDVRGENLKTKLLKIPKVKYYSQKAAVSELKEENFGLSELKFIGSKSSCNPVWLRWEQDNNLFGNEKVRVQFNESRDSANPLSFVLPKAGRASLATIGNYLIYATHARSDLGVLRFANNSFEVVK